MSKIKAHKIVPRKNRHIKICGRNYRLKFNKNVNGASFSTHSAKGRGEITIGTKETDIEELAERVGHEAIEAILTEDDKRFCNFTCSYDDPNYIFIFNHDYLCGFTYKLIDALVLSGFFKIVDGRK